MFFILLSDVDISCCIGLVFVQKVTYMYLSFHRYSQTLPSCFCLNLLTSLHQMMLLTRANYKDGCLQFCLAKGVSFFVTEVTMNTTVVFKETRSDFLQMVWSLY